MPKATLIVLSNPVAGREAEYNDWYTNQHLDDVLKVPGIIGATRLKLQGDLGTDITWRYCALYDVDHADPAEILSELNARSGTDRMPLNDALDINGVHAAIYVPFVTKKR
ncbi:DUF4286 family protein [Novosphingobium fluoreni]|uniref:DUF4286 family protein n=1 Tax=Novosphingobium fluoreni TaxID=1391222 RepID=UPI000736631C|nr:hypothetical protein NS277_15865 [Novosphingobium barchaimii]